MSTRSLIGLGREDGSIRYVYCHFDGYLSWNGRILLEKYTSVENIERLIALGDFSKLCDTVEETAEEAYAKKRGEKLNIGAASDLTLFIEDCLESWCDYAYIFADGKWYYTRMYYEDNIKKIEPFLMLTKNKVESEE